jgi:hypothetical protein
LLLKICEEKYIESMREYYMISKGFTLVELDISPVTDREMSGFIELCLYIICWRKLRNEELHNLYYSPSIIRMIKSRRMKWAGHVARVGREGMPLGYWWESRKEGDH